MLPTLVYMAREKRAHYHHNFKAGAMNALVHSRHQSFTPECMRFTFLSSTSDQYMFSIVYSTKIYS